MKHSWLLPAVLMLAACSPQIYPLYLDVRQPSASGLDLSRRSFAIVYPEGAQPADSLFDRQAASALARQLEADYFDGREEVGLYCIPAPDSLTLPLMHDLVMDTNADVIFLLSSRLGTPDMGQNQVVSGATSVDSAFVCPFSLPVQTNLTVYDSMGQDKMYSFKGSTVLRSSIYNDGLPDRDGLQNLMLRRLDREGDEVGSRIANRFLSQWKTESFSFYYFDDFSADMWEGALRKLTKGELHQAMDLWMGLTQEKDALKRACAAYNMAQALYLLEDFEMSGRWLDAAEKWENLSLAPGLRKRLDSRLEKSR